MTRDYARTVRGISDHWSVGTRIAHYRGRRGLTQAVLAGLVGRSEDWLSKIERGERPVRNIDVLVEVARAPRVTLGDLIGQPVLAEDEERLDDVPAVRDALMSPRSLLPRLFGSDGQPPPDVSGIASLASFAWDDFQRGRLGEVVTALPGLVTSAQALEDAAARDASVIGRRDRWALSARIHHLVSTTLIKFGETDLAWLAAERAIRAGDASGDPLALASAARAGTHALLALGRFREASELGSRAAIWLDENLPADDPAALSLLGMLHLRMALAAARRGDRAATEHLLGLAAEAARRLGRDANLWHTGFGPTNVVLHRFAAALGLGDVAYVVEHGPAVRPDNLPVERTVGFRIDLARALALAARDAEAVQVLLTAEDEAPSLVRHNVVVRETVRDLHRRDRNRTRLLAELAERCRAVA